MSSQHSPQLGRPAGQLKNRASNALSIMRTALSAPLLRIKKDKSASSTSAASPTSFGSRMLSAPHHHHQHNDGSRSSPDLPSNSSLNDPSPVSATFFDKASSSHEVSVEDFLSRDNFNHYSNLKIITEPLKDNSDFHGNNNTIAWLLQGGALFGGVSPMSTTSSNSANSATPTAPLQQQHRRHDSIVSALTDEHDITPQGSPRLQPTNNFFFNEMDGGNNAGTLSNFLGVNINGGGKNVEGDCTTPRDSMAFSFNLDNMALNLDSMAFNEQEELDDELMRMVMLNKPKNELKQGRLSVSSGASDDTAGENDDEEANDSVGGSHMMQDDVDVSKARRHKHHRTMDDDLVSEAESNSNVPLVADSYSSREWRCFVPTCGKIYTTGAGLRYHIRHYHQMKNVPIRAARKSRKEKQTQWSCSHCGKLYTSYAGLKYHQTNFDHSAPRNNNTSNATLTALANNVPQQQSHQQQHFSPFQPMMQQQQQQHYARIASNTHHHHHYQQQSSPFHIMSGMEVIPEGPVYEGGGGIGVGFGSLFINQ